MSFYAFNMGGTVAFSRVTAGRKKPDGAIVISDEQHAAAIQEINSRVCDASASIIDGRLVISSQQPPSIENTKKIALESINAEFERAVLTLRSAYPDSEVLSWSRQESEARAWLENNSISTPLIQQLCDARGIQKPDMVNRIITKADAYAAAFGQLIGKRQRLESMIDALNENSTAQQWAEIAW